MVVQVDVWSYICHEQSSRFLNRFIMKNLVRNSVLIFAMFMLTVATALANNPSLKLEKTADKIISFTVDKLSTPVNISFKDESGSLIYKETYTFDKVSSRNYNLKEIESGKYYFEVETDASVEIYLILVNNETAEIYKEVKNVLYKPLVTVKDNGKVVVTKLNLSKDDLVVTVYDEKGNELYSENVSADTKDFTIGRKFDFSKVEKGSYTFYLTTDGKTYTKIVSL